MSKQNSLTDTNSANFIEGKDQIGYGYNIFGAYASGDGLMQPVIDWDKGDIKPVSFDQTKHAPELVDAIHASESYYTNYSGTTFSSYQNSFSFGLDLSLGLDLFSGSFSYGDNIKKDQSNAFSRVQQTVSMWQLSVRPEWEKLKTMLDDTFARDLAEAVSEAQMNSLFDTYGSHFLTGIVVGGKAWQEAYMSRSDMSHAFSFDVAAKASLQAGTGSASASGEAHYKNDTETFSEKANKTTHILGGKYSIPSASGFSSREDYVEWLASVPGNPIFCDFRKKDSLTPIWKLCATADQANQLETFFTTKWGPKTAYESSQKPDYLTKLKIDYDKHISNWHVVPVDLNKGTSGYTMYLHYQTATPLKKYEQLASNPECIVDITAVASFDEDIKAPEGYHKLKIDANEGVSGEYIYICYKTAPYDPKLAITEVKLVHAHFGHKPQPPYGYVKVDIDLNTPNTVQDGDEEAIYLCFVRGNGDTSPIPPK